METGPDSPLDEDLINKYRRQLDEAYDQKAESERKESERKPPYDSSHPGLTTGRDIFLGIVIAIVMLAVGYTVYTVAQYRPKENNIGNRFDGLTRATAGLEAAIGVGATEVQFSARVQDVARELILARQQDSLSVEDNLYLDFYANLLNDCDVASKAWQHRTHVAALADVYDSDSARTQLAEADLSLHEQLNKVVGGIAILKTWAKSKPYTPGASDNPVAPNNSAGNPVVDNSAEKPATDKSEYSTNQSPILAIKYSELGDDWYWEDAAGMHVFETREEANRAYLHPKDGGVQEGANVDPAMWRGLCSSLQAQYDPGIPDADAANVIDKLEVYHCPAKGKK